MNTASRYVNSIFSSKIDDIEKNLTIDESFQNCVIIDIKFNSITGELTLSFEKDKLVLWLKHGFFSKPIERLKNSLFISLNDTISKEYITCNIKYKINNKIETLEFYDEIKSYGILNFDPEWEIV